MISMLLMSIFADPAPALAFRDNPKTKTTEWAFSRPDLDTAGADARKFVAAAVTKKTGSQDRDALTAGDYVMALEKARSASKIKEVTVGIVGNQFTISAFAKEAGLALVRFYKNVTDGTKNLLACVIDIASTGKNDADVTEAAHIQGSWLKRFHEIIFGADKISDDKKMTAYTAVDDLVQDSNTSKTFADLKGLVPRNDGRLTQEERDALKVVGDDKLNGTFLATESQRKLATILREPEKWGLVLPLVVLQQAGIDVSGVVSSFSKKVGKLVDALDKVENGTRAAFENDNEPSQLQLDFWKVIWDGTILEIASKNLSQSATDTLMAQSLAKLDELAEKYRTAP